MNREKKKLLRHFEERAKSYEERKLYKQASKLRKASRDGTAKRESLDVWVERIRREEQTSAADGVEGQIVGIERGQCTVRLRDEHATVPLTTSAAIGDRVLIRSGRIDRVLPRRTKLSRPDPHNPHLERVIAANVDAVVHVSAAKLPGIKPGLIDRFLIAIERGGADPILCVNKMDLLNDPAELSLLESHRRLGVPIVFCSATTAQGLDELRTLLQGKLCAFAGHSGVGKSSLMNALDPRLGLPTASMSVLGKGRHTTTSSALHELPGGLRVIDTPGIREFGLWKLTAEELRRYFHEFEPYVTRCRFRDCSHIHEPKCGVREAVAAGEVSESRYEAYCRIFGENSSARPL